MADFEDEELKKVLEKALWQVEESKKMGLSISKSMNFINLSKEAQDFGNKRLAIGLLKKARDTLFNDIVEKVISSLTDDSDIVSKMRLERTISDARSKYTRDEVKESYDILLSTMRSQEECAGKVENICLDEDSAEKYSKALDYLQKVWLKMKQEENKGKDMIKAKGLIKEAKISLSKKRYDHVMTLCQEVMDTIQSPQDKLKEEVDETIEDITKTLRAIFPDKPRSPKERFFKKQIEDLISDSMESINHGKPVEAINSSRKAKEILSRLEQDSIKGDIPKMIIELRGSIDELKKNNVDISYEEYLLKQVEETFWKGEYISARKIVNKLSNIVANAKNHLTVNQLSTRITTLNHQIMDSAGQEGYLQAKEYLDKAKILMEESAFDLASSFLDKAGNALEN